MGARVRSWWQKTIKPIEVIGIIAVCVLLVALIVVDVRIYGTGFKGKRLWDWLQLLIIPVVLALGGYLFTFTISRNERKAADRHNQTERDIASDNQREAALQEYIDKMSELLLEKKLRESQPEDEVRTIARVRTLTVLPRLDGERKRSVLQFLHESGLIEETNIIDLNGADLSHANLRGARLLGTNLSYANLSEADLTHTNLAKANLTFAKLIGANLREALLADADLNNAILDGADLTSARLRGNKTILSYAELKGANLHDADLKYVELIGVDLSGARPVETYFRDADLQGANLEDADLRKATLWNANLKGAYLKGADLRGAELTGDEWAGDANLERADLSGTNLEGAIVTSDQLKQARSLKGATMPDGSIHP